MTSASVHYTLSVWEGSRCVKSLPTARNLILDSGLDAVASSTWAACFAWAACGTGTDPVKRDSGAVTFSRAGNVVTASAGFFEAGDVGRLLKWDTGEEVRITGFTSNVSVTTSDAGTIAAGEGTVWYVSRTALGAQFSNRTNSLSADAGDNGESYAGGVAEIWRTFVFPAFGSGQTIREIGWGPESTGSLFGMDLLAVPVGVAIGQTIRVEVRLRLTMSPASTVALSFGWAGVETWTHVLENVSLANVTGTNWGGTANEPSVAGTFYLGDHALTPAAPPAVSKHANVYLKAVTAAAYVPGTFRRSFSVSIAPTDYTGPFRNASVGSADGTGGAPFSAYSWRASAAITKTSAHTLSFAWEKAWGRTLVN